MPLAHAGETAAGYAVLRVTDDSRSRPVHLDVWYPASSAEQPLNYGISMGLAARGTAVSGSNIPVVLLSHGAMGAATNYSWLAERLARRGYLVLGVSHFGESPVFGPPDPATASLFGDRTRDLEFALAFLVERSAYARHVDPGRIAIVGHSSGGAAALMLAGAEFRSPAVVQHCQSAAGHQDKGCLYGSTAPVQDEGRTPVPTKRRLRAVVVLDPAVGPGFTGAGLQALETPVLVVGSTGNDFLPFDSHAGRIARLLRHDVLLKLEQGEGHFVFLDECNLPLEAHGVKLCTDQRGVSRSSVHENLAAAIGAFLDEHLE